MRSDQSFIKEEADLSARDLLVILFKFKYRMLVAFAVITLLLTAVPLLKRPLYEAKSTLLIKIGREFRNRTEVNGSRQLMISPDGINNSEIQILTSRDSIKRVINTIELGNLYPDLLRAPPKKDKLESAALLFTKALTVQEVKNSNVIEVSFKHHDPRIAALAVNLLVEIFKEKHLETFSDTDSAFIENQLARYQSKLQDSGSRLQEFKQKMGVVSQEEQVKLLLERSAALDGEKIELRNRIKALEAKVPILKARARKVLALVPANTDTSNQRALDETESRLVNMQLEEQQLLMKYPESNPLVQSLRKRMDVLKSFQRELEARKNDKSREADPAYQSAELEVMNAETELEAQKSKLAALQKEGQSVAQQIRLLEQSEEAIQNLKREQNIDEKNYQTFVSRAEEARISKDMDSLKLANVSVIQKANVPIEPVEPKVMKVLLRGLALGLAAGVGLAIASEIYGHGLSTPQALERRLGLKVLLSINKQ